MWANFPYVAIPAGYHTMGQEQNTVFLHLGRMLQSKFQQCVTSAKPELLTDQGASILNSSKMNAELGRDFLDQSK